ncbi:hypothetical protein QT970_09450 [Microcoleus sp. herbarium8]
MRIKFRCPIARPNKKSPAPKAGLILLVLSPRQRTSIGQSIARSIALNR